MLTIILTDINIPPEKIHLIGIFLIHLHSWQTAFTHWHSHIVNGKNEKIEVEIFVAMATK